MSRPRRRHAIAAVLAAAALPFVTACGAGPNAQTDQVRSPGDGVGATVGTLRILNALVVAPSTGPGVGAAVSPSASEPQAPASGTATGGASTSSPASSSASAAGVLSMTVVNDGTAPDRLTGVQSPDARITISGPTDLPQEAPLRLGPVTGTREAAATVTELRKGPGEYLALRIVFERAGMLDLQVPVMPAVNEYQDVRPSTSPTTQPSLPPIGSGPASPASSAPGQSSGAPGVASGAPPSPSTTRS